MTRNTPYVSLGHDANASESRSIGCHGLAHRWQTTTILRFNPRQNSLHIVATFEGGMDAGGLTLDGMLYGLVSAPAVQGHVRVSRSLMIQRSECTTLMRRLEGSAAGSNIEMDTSEPQPRRAGMTDVPTPRLTYMRRASPPYHPLS